MLTNYTTYDDIRGCLGVNNEELEDSVLALEVYSVGLTMELRKVASGLITAYEEVMVLDADLRTAEQTYFFEATRIFAAYAVAKQLTPALPLLAPKDITDGKAALGRFADSPYRETIKRIVEQYDQVRNDLVLAYSVVQSTTATATKRILFGGGSPSYDPVTGS